MVVKIEGRELKQVKGRTGWAGWAPNTEDERGKFKSRVLCLPKGRVLGWRREMEEGRCHYRKDWEEAVASVMTTTTATRNHEKFKVLDDLREPAAAAKCRDPLSRKVLRKRARRARREFDEGWRSPKEENGSQTANPETVSWRKGE